MSTSQPRRRVALRTATLLAVVGLAAGLSVSACGSDDDTASDDTGSTSSIAVTDVWARSSPVVATAGAAYMVISNNGEADDALVSAAVDPSVAARVELHETRGVAEGEDEMAPTTDMASAEPSDMDTTVPMGTVDTEMETDSTAPMMEMVPVDRIAVAADSAVALEPGGYHVMLLDLVTPLENGDEIELTLTFEVAGEQVVTAVVGDSAP